MQLWTFGLFLLLVLSTWMSLSTADDDSDGEDDHDDGDCFLYKEVKCLKRKDVKDRCDLISKYFYCAPTCGSYFHTTSSETHEKSIFKKVYLCPTSTTFAAPSTTIQMLCDEDSGSGSGCESEYNPPSSIFFISPSLSTVTIPEVSSTSSNGNDYVSSYHRKIRQSVSLSIVPSSTPPAPFPTTATSTMLEESNVSSISPSSTLPTAGPSSSDGEDNDKDDDDNDKDDDDDDDKDEDECDDDNECGGDDCDDASADVSVHDPWSDDDQGMAKNQHAKFASKQKISCKTSSVIQNMKTSDWFTLLSVPPSIITSSGMSHLVQSSITSIRISTSATKSVSHPKIISPSMFPGISSTFAATSSSHPSTSSPTPPLSTSVILESSASVVISPPVKNGRETSTKITISPSSTFTGVVSMSATTQKPKISGTLFGTKTISPSTFPGISSTFVASSGSYSSTFFASSGSYSSLSSPTPPLSSSVNLESNTSVAATTVVFSTTLQYSEVNFTVVSPSFNGTVKQSISITPTMTATVLASSSIIEQQRTVFCGESETGDKFEKGVLTWPRTPVGIRANTTCPYNKNKTAIAHRWCRMGNHTQYWDKVNNDNCSVLEKDTSIDEVAKMNITEENEGTVAVLVDYITSTSNATVDLVKSGADILEKLVDDATNLSKIRKEILSSVSNVMNADPTVLAAANKQHNSTTRILKFIGKLMDEMSLSGKARVRENFTNLVAEAWDVANMTGNLTFESNSNIKDEGSLVSVTLPSSLLQRYKQRRRITFINFLNDKLFPQDEDPTQRFINSKIVSASIKGDEVRNLSDPVIIDFKITNKSFANNRSCVFWDFEGNGGLGQWSTNGCVYEIIDDGRSQCNCNHLTHFGILVDLFPKEDIGATDKLVLEGITFIGCYLSIVGLVLTIITFLSLKQYRNGVSGQILLNLCLALLFSLVIFLGGIEQVDNEGTCVTMAALLHYFVLAAVLWMGVEAFHMFVNIVLDRLPGELGKTFVLKCAAVAWVVPMFIVVITVLVNTDDYKDKQYCRVKGNSFYIAFLGPVLTVLLFNVIAFLLVVKSLLSQRIINVRHKQGIVHFRRVLGIAIIFGITWLFGVLAVGELRLIFQYLFAITNSFQGFMIFILYCLTDRKVRERLARFLCALPDPNPSNRIIDSTSTQRPTDIEIDLSLFQEKPTSSRPRNWSGTWPIQGHSNTPRVFPEEMSIDPVIVYPPPIGASYNSGMLTSGHNPNILASNYDPNLTRPGYLSQPGDPDHDSNPAWEYELDTIDPPYNYRNPPGSRPVTNVHLPGEVSGDKLVDSTMSQLERSGGEISLQSVNSVLFFDNGKRVEVPKHPELSGDNYNWKETRTKRLDDSRTLEQSLEGPRRFTEGGDGLSFYKKPTRQRHSSATTSDELDKRFVFPKGKSLRDHKGVHFSADQLTDSSREPRWSDMRAFPRLKTHPREEDISENDEVGRTSISRIEYERRHRRIAQPTRVIDDDLEKEYLRSYGNDHDNEEENISSRFQEMKTTVRPQEEAPIESEREVKLQQSMISSGSETSSDDTSVRWSEIGHAPNLKSYSQTTFSDLDSNDGEVDGDGTHFTQF